MAMMFGLTLPTPFGIPHDWIMLLFSTPVALWTSNVFHIGAYYSLRSRVLNMSVLVSLGVLVGGRVVAMYLPIFKLGAVI